MPPGNGLTLTAAMRFRCKARVRQVATLISVDEGIGIAFAFGNVAQCERKAAQREVIVASSNLCPVVFGQIQLASLQQQCS